jgi:hypothetical protein
MAQNALDAFIRFFTHRQGLSAPVTAEAHNRNKKKKNGGRKNVFSRCISQISACESFVQDACVDNAACLAAATPCCERMGSCDFTGFIGCINDATAA